MLSRAGIQPNTKENSPKLKPLPPEINRLLGAPDEVPALNLNTLEALEAAREQLRSPLLMDLSDTWESELNAHFQSVLREISEKSEGVKMATEGELTDAKIAAAEARTDTKITRLDGKLDLVLSKISELNDNSIAARREIKDSERAVKANAYVIFAAVVALIIGVVAAAPVVFDLGAKFRESITKEVQEQVQHKTATPTPH